MNFRESSWYAVKVKNRHEKSAFNALEGKGFPSYLPLYRTKRRWSDRTKILELPLFPTYVFCSFRPGEQGTIVNVPGVVSVLSFGNHLVPVRSEELEYVEILAKSGLSLTPLTATDCGTPVCIEEGPLRGLEGVVVRVRSSLRLVVSVTLLQRAVAVEIDQDWIRRKKFRIPRREGMREELAAVGQ